MNIRESEEIYILAVIDLGACSERRAVRPLIPIVGTEISK
jgi:hypothetical protein